MPLLVLDPVRSLLVSQGLTAPDPEQKAPEVVVKESEVENKEKGV